MQMSTEAVQAPAVAVIGNLLTDLIVAGLDKPPAWGREVAGRDFRAVPSGQAALFAQAIAALGWRTVVVGTVGDDAAGQNVLAALATSGIDVANIAVADGVHTGVSLVLVRDDGERAFVTAFGAMAATDEKLLMGCWARVSAETVCLLGLNNLPALPLPAVRRLLSRARNEGRRTVLDTGWDIGGWQEKTVHETRELLAEVDIFLPNLDEARALTGEQEPDAAAAKLAEDGAGVVVVKCGAEGAYARAGSEEFFDSAYPVEVVDAVGAGDVFDAGFLHGYTAAADVQTGLRRGNAAAALYVSRAADRFPSLDEVRGLEGCDLLLGPVRKDEAAG